ncbi:MAG TPA: multiheme c-type cytochrome [Acidobacteriota bacterium]|nr:multiheme c-type cytochrome [Acidobacteriota bacterium]
MKKILPLLTFFLILMLSLVAQTADKKSGSTPQFTYDKSLTGDPHKPLFSKSQYPSASECAPCHQKIYEEWRFSNHAYASISPMFNKFEQRITDLSSGTVGFFCMRCHSGIGTAMREPREQPTWQRAQVSREGVTCISCHRVNEEYGKVDAERHIIPGEPNKTPMWGPFDGTLIEEVLKNKDYYKVALNKEDLGINIHNGAVKFDHIATSEFCVSCHQVAVVPGIKLETVWDEYRASPAHKKGVSCQDCHMSTVPGKNSGYEKGPSAVINGKEIGPERQHSNHGFIGPGYPVSHPGIFPHNPDGQKWSVEAWLKFDYRAGWGTDAFEDKVAKGQLKVNFPPEWASPDDRVQAALVVESNMKKLQEKSALRKVLMEGGSRLDGPFIKGTPRVGKGLKFTYTISNLNPGHNMPSGSLGAQPELWLNVALIDPDGKNVWESGYVDKNGDFCDNHSLEVRAGTIKADQQLVNLQSKFLTTNLKGTDREMYLPVPFEADQIPFIRPGPVPVTNLNHPPTIRMEKRSLPPLGSRDADYSVPGSALSKPGKYHLAVRLRSRAEPIYFMKFCFATDDMIQGMLEWMLDIHPYTVEFDVK